MVVTPVTTVGVGVLRDDSVGVGPVPEDRISSKDQHQHQCDLINHEQNTVIAILDLGFRFHVAGQHDPGHQRSGRRLRP